jgi:hypothetical protein
MLVASKTFSFDAAAWKTPADLYESLVTTLGAPPWHGYSVDAIVDSVIWQDCNEVKPPFVFKFSVFLVPLVVWFKK